MGKASHLVSWMRKMKRSGSKGWGHAEKVVASYKRHLQASFPERPYWSVIELRLSVNNSNPSCWRKAQNKFLMEGFSKDNRGRRQHPDMTSQRPFLLTKYPYDPPNFQTRIPGWGHLTNSWDMSRNGVSLASWGLRQIPPYVSFLGICTFILLLLSLLSLSLIMWLEGKDSNMEALQCGSSLDLCQ